MGNCVEKFPDNSFLVTGPKYYQEIIKTIYLYDILTMSYQPNEYDSSAIVIKKNGIACGHVPQDSKQKVSKFVPSQVRVIDKRLIEPYVWNMRVDII